MEREKRNGGVKGDLLPLIMASRWPILASANVGTQFSKANFPLTTMMKTKIVRPNCNSIPSASNGNRDAFISCMLDFPAPSQRKEDDTVKGFFLHSYQKIPTAI